MVKENKCMNHKKIEISWHQTDRECMKVNQKNEVIYLTFPQLDNCDFIRHGFTTRMGGVSKGIFASMNLSFTRGDEESEVRENYRRISDAIGFEYESIVTSDQTHTTNVRVVTEADRGNGITKPRPYTDVDGMVTNVPGLTLATFYADCVPLYFVDPVHRAVGLSHSGWRGTVGKMGKVTVETMNKEFGSNPEDILAAIGPSICEDCYEVSEDVIEEVREAFSKRYWDELFYGKENGKYQLNLWKTNERILLEAGVLPEHISMPNLCTCCNPGFLFSHRASKGKRGNLAAFLQIMK